MSLLIAMPGPRLPEFENAAAARAALPVLPALSSLLTRARRLPDAAHWRAGVLAACGAPGPATGIAQAAVAARALTGLAADTALCMVEPLHLVAGISRVHLPPDGRLRLEAGELLRWANAFNREFSGPQLHAVAGGWLLVAPFAHGARDPAPEVLLGEPLERVAARDEAERALRRLGAEVEMWLAAQPLNREREARQLPPLNALWFWGGARAAALPPLARPPRVLCVAGEPDAWLAGLAAHCAAPLLRVAAWQDLPPGDSTLLALPQLAGSLRHWGGLDAQWFEPVAQALRDGSLDALRLQIGGRAWQLPDPSPLRLLRRRRPWHERAGA